MLCDCTSHYGTHSHDLLFEIARLIFLHTFAKILTCSMYNIMMEIYFKGYKHEWSDTY